MVTILDHPLLSDRVRQLRDVATEPARFRALVHHTAMLMTPQVCHGFETASTDVTTPLETTEAVRLARRIVLVPILRAGIGFAEGFHRLLPEAQVAHLGITRNENTLRPELYYSNLPAPPDLAEAEILVVDPMLATGGSAVEAINQVKQGGGQRVRFACLIAAPEGISRLREVHPDVPLFAAAQDRCLNEKGYICPGLGDAGDRIFGTL